MSNRADLRERTKTTSRPGDRRGQIADFRDSFETINWLYLFFKCGIKTKTHFEWLLWHWSSLGQLNLEPTRPNGLVGCRVPTDLVKISVKDMGFHYSRPLASDVSVDKRINPLDCCQLRGRGGISVRRYFRDFLSLCFNFKRLWSFAWNRSLIRF